MDHHGLQVGIPPELSGFDHFGDLDQSHGFLFVPVQRPDKTRPAIAVFNASDLSLVTWQTLPNPAGEGDWQTNGGAWVAIRPDSSAPPDTGRLVVRDDVSLAFPLVEFEFSWSLLGTETLLLHSPRNVYLLDREEMAVGMQTIQGGAFNPDGTLFYAVNGYCDNYGALRVFGVSGNTWVLQAEAVAEDPRWPFKFEQHPQTQLLGYCTGQEPEGLDFFDVVGRGIPGIPDGQLHALLLDNNAFEDAVWLKHYSY